MARLVTATLTILGLAAIAAASTPDFAQLREATQRHPDVAAAVDQSRQLLADANILSHHEETNAFSRIFAAQQSGTAVANANANANLGESACRSLLATPLMAPVNASCPYFHTTGIAAVFDISNVTTASTDAAASMCSTGCVDAINTLVRAVPQCFATGPGKLFNLLPRMCTMHDGQACSTRLRAMPKTECDKYNHNQTGCESPTRWCAFDMNSQKCEFKSTAARLQQVCTPCLDIYINVIFSTLEVGASRNGSPSRAAVKRWDFARKALLNQKLFWCGKVDDQWCHVTFSAVDDRAFNFDRTNNMSLAEVQQNLTNTCTVNGRRCLNKVVGAMTNTLADAAEYAAWNCMQESCSNSRFSNLQRCSDRNARCALGYTLIAAVGAATSGVVDFVCSRNAADAVCGNVMHKYLRQDCWANLSSTCSATCASWLMNNMSAEAGCCIDKYHSVVTSVYSYDTIPGYLRGELNATAVRMAGRKTAKNHPLWGWNVRCNASVSTFNMSQVLYNTRACAQAEPVRKALTLRGLRWSKVQSNATLRMSLEVTLRADVARTMGVAADAIVNGTLVNDTTQVLTLSTAATRRQSASASASASNWTAGVKYEFAVVTDSAAMATAAASSFDAAVNTGAIEVAATAAVLADDCADCLGSPTAAPGETPAPPPTGPNAFSSIAGSSSATAGAASAAATAGSTTLLVGIVAAAAAAMLF